MTMVAPTNPTSWNADQVLYYVEKILLEREKRWDERDRRWEEIVRRLDQAMREKDLRDQQRFDAQQKALIDALQSAALAVTAALTAANTAVGKAEVANEKRLDGVNEFRRTVEDLTKFLATKAEIEPQFAAIREKLTDLTDRFNRREGSGEGAGRLWSYGLGALGAAAIVFEFVTRKP